MWWRLVVLALLACEAISEEAQPRKTLSQEIGSPSELAWQAWLLVENKAGSLSQQQSNLDSSNILRRITPKSIFIAPELVSCPPGYSSDGKGICKPDPINIDENAQRQFFLKRLNALYGKLGNSKKKPEQQAQGPLQINIPISVPGKGIVEAKPQKIEQVVVAQNNSQEAVTVVVYELANATKKTTDDSDKTSFFLGTSNSSQETPRSTAPPELEVKETFSGVVDYKTADRLPSEKKIDAASSEDASPTLVLLLSPTKLPFVSTTTPPTTIPTTTTARPTTTTERLIELANDETSADQVESTTTMPVTQDDVKFESDSTIQTVAPLDVQTNVDEVESTVRTTTERTYYTQTTRDIWRSRDQQVITTTQVTPSQDDETAYTDDYAAEETDDAEYDDAATGGSNGDEKDEEDFADEDELLKPGEAGMMISSSSNQDILRTKTTAPDAPISTTILDTTTTIPTVAVNEDGEVIMSTQTTEIPSTFFTTEETTMFTQGVRETYPPTMYTERVRETQPPATFTQGIRGTLPPTTFTQGNRETLPPSTLTYGTRGTLPPTTIAHGNRETMPPTTFTHGVRGTQPPTTFNHRYRGTHPPATTTEKIYERDTIVTDPEVILSTQGNFGRKKLPISTTYNFEEIPRTETPPELPTQRYQKKPMMNEPIYLKNEGHIPSEFKDQVTFDLKREPSFVHFPESPSAQQPQRGYVRFPSDEVNSIHGNQDVFKDRHLLPIPSAYRSRDDFSPPTSSTKSSVPARPAHWRLQPNLRGDRQQSSRSQQQQQKPMLLKFWARMPLVRDLSFYPTTSHGSHVEPIGGAESQHRLNSRFSPVTPPARRVNYFKDVSSHDVDRLLAEQLGG